MKVVKYFIICTLIISFAVKVQGQNDANDFTKVAQILPPSPNAASLGKYGGIDVGLSSGAVNHHIPIFDYTSTSIKVPISLSYTSTGFKVDEIASRVGIGWSLNAGGVITRTVYGGADENPRLTVPSDFPNVSRNLINFMDHIVGSSEGPIPATDAQPDIFNFNFNGYSGRFVLDSTFKPAMLSHSNLKVEWDLVRPGFKITTGEGVQYFFGGNGANEYTTKTTSGTECGDRYLNSNVQTAWYLYQIVHPNHDTVNLVYSSLTTNYQTGVTEVMYAHDIREPNVQFCSGWAPGFNPPYLSNNNCTNGVQTGVVLLQEINSASGGKVKFTYIGRNDYNDRLVSTIDMYQPGGATPFKTFAFDYLYSFDGSRPFLKTLTEKGRDLSSVKTHSFLYNEYNSVPGQLSYSQDHWGYFNGKTNATLIPLPNDALYRQFLPAASANREPDPAYAQKGLLSAVIYPTGGRDSIIYEGNQAYKDVVITPDAVNVGANAIIPDLSFGVASGLSDAVVVSDPQLVLVSGHCERADPSINNSDPGGTDINVIDLNTNTSVYYIRLQYDQASNEAVQLYAGHSYKIRVDVYGPNVTGGSGFSYYPGVMTVQKMNAPVGGVRVAKVLTTDNATNNTTIKKYIYSDPETPSVSSGISIYEPNYKKYLQVYIPCRSIVNGTNPCNEILVFNYFSMYSNSLNNVYGFSSSPVAYSDVVESFGEAYENGGIEHKFTVNPDEPAVIYLGGDLLGGPLTSYGWRNGRETYQFVFKRSGSNLTPVKKVYTHYKEDARVDQRFFGYVANRKYVNNAYPCIDLDNPEPWEVNEYELSRYAIFRKWVYVDSVRTLQYDNNGLNYLETIAATEYGNMDHAMPTKTTTIFSDGRSGVVNTYYPQDLVLTGPAEIGRQSLIGQHILSPVLQQQILKGSVRTYNASTEYAVFGSGLVLPRSKSLQLGEGPMEKRVDFYRYNTTGGVLEQGKTNDAKECYLWDYGNLYPVAHVVNADSATIAYTSFEAEGTGNWSIGSSSRNTGGAVTGNLWYSLNSNISKSGLSSINTYIVSYWTKNTSPFSITGTITGYPVKGKTINGWTLYMHKVTGQSTITINGSGSVDELRLYPVDAQMTTYTYDPLIGITSQCDVSSRLSYYEYDGLQRLLRARDMDGNIVKQFEYQYQSSTRCGSNCYVLTMTNLAGANTLSYPVGVFNANGKLLDTASNQARFITVWNADAENANRGTLSAGGDGMHFQLALNTGKALPAITGCRYYKVDLAWNQFDGVRNINGCYVDFGDGASVRLPSNPGDVINPLPANTIQQGTSALYLVHTYADASLKTLTFYHNDAEETQYLDNVNSPATSLSKLKNFRGNLPQHIKQFGSSSYQQASMSSVANITNWASIHSINDFHLNTGDAGITTIQNLTYQQDFMAGNPDLQSIQLARNNLACYFDATFKISRLKSDWNTWFKHLQFLSLTDAQWNREDLSALKELNYFYIIPGRPLYSNNPTNNAEIPIPQNVVDGIFNQIALGSGQTVSGGVLYISSAGSGRSSFSDAAVNTLLAKGWTLYLDGQQLH